MVFFEFLTWAAVGMGAGAVRTAMTPERDAVREMKLGLVGAIPGGILGLLADGPRVSFSVVSLLFALGAAVCVLLLDWLLDDTQAQRRSV